MVVKLGGASLADEIDLAEVCSYVAFRAHERRVVVVHGGGQEIGGLHERLGVPFQKAKGLRVTSETSMPLVVMVLRGLVNARLVARLVGLNLAAIGLSGVDLGFMRTDFLNRSTLGRVGGPPTVFASVLRLFLDDGFVPVVAPVCLGPDGGPVNVNADAVANAIAVSLSADALEFVCDVASVRTEEGGARSLSVHEAEALIHSGVAREGMVPKLQAAAAALTGGVRVVRVGTHRSLFTDLATEICP